MYDELATAAESAAEWKYLRVLYDIYRKRFQQLRPVKDQNGNLLTSAEDQITIQYNTIAIDIQT